MNPEFSQQSFEIYSNNKFHENPSSGSQVVLCGRTDMTKVIVTFRNFAYAPKNGRRPGTLPKKQYSFGNWGEFHRKITSTFVFHFFVSKALIFKLG